MWVITNGFALSLGVTDVLADKTAQASSYASSGFNALGNAGKSATGYGRQAGSAASGATKKAGKAAGDSGVPGGQAAQKGIEGASDIAEV